MLQEYPFFAQGRGWVSCCPHTTSQLYQLLCQQLAVGDICVVWSPGRGDMTPLGLGRSLPKHRTGIASTGTGLPSLGAGHDQGAGWLLAQSTAGNPGQAAPRRSPAPLASPALRRCSFLSSHIPLRVFMAFLSPRCPRLKSPLLREPEDYGLLEPCLLRAAGCSLAMYRLIYWESSLALFFS